MQTMLSSSLIGWGCASLDQDVEELSLLTQHLQSAFDSEVLVHSACLQLHTCLTACTRRRSRGVMPNVFIRMRILPHMCKSSAVALCRRSSSLATQQGAKTCVTAQCVAAMQASCVSFDTRYPNNCNTQSDMQQVTVALFCDTDCEIREYARRVSARRRHLAGIGTPPACCLPAISFT